MSPACGWALRVLSNFTTSTGWGVGSARPFSGEVGVGVGAGVGVGVGVGVGLALPVGELEAVGEVGSVGWGEVDV